MGTSSSIIEPGSEQRLLSLRIKHLHRASAIHRYLRTLRRKIAIKRMQLSIVLFAPTLQSSQAVSWCFNMKKF